jgi:uncharacterized repeat protein (TIGR01451 family)
MLKISLWLLHCDALHINIRNYCPRLNVVGSAGSRHVVDRTVDSSPIRQSKKGDSNVNTHSRSGTPNPACVATHPQLITADSMMEPGHANPSSQAVAERHMHSPALARRTAAALPAIVGAWLVLALAMPALAANGTGQIGNFCAGQFVNPANCTANDVLFEEFQVVEVVESCTQGVLGEAEVVFDAIVVSNSPNRYGIGLFVNLEGTSAITGNLCLHDFLSPVHPSTNPGDWPTEIVNGGPAFVAPFPNINGDQCGDIPGGSRVLKQLQQVRIECADQNNDGFVDLSACASWENNANAQCNNLNQAVPGTPSKCGCTTVTTELAMPAFLTIRKETTDGEGTFEFVTTSDPQYDPTFSLPASFSITTSGGVGSEDFGGVVEPGTYTIDEIVPDGWNLASATCTNGDDPQLDGGGVTLAPGESVTCTFVNTPVQPGTITITKSAQGADGPFQFTGDLGTFEITTVSGSGTEVFTDLLPGTYDVTETIPSGWSLVGISCQSDDDSSTSISGATASIDLGEGGNVSCTFTNARHGTIVVDKVADPDDTDQMFDFSSNFAGDFSLGSGESVSTPNLQPSSLAGTYSVSEIVPDGWSLVSATCTGGNSPDAINLQPGQTVNCTFTNAIDRGTIIVEKIADPDDTDQMFDFTSNFAGDFSLGAGDNLATGNLLPSSEAGAYSVSENVPAGWSLVSATCDDGSDPDSIDLQPGETVTCTFSNAIDRGTIIVEKIADPDDTDQMFDFTSNFAGDFSLGAGDNLATGNLLPSSEAGAYSVSENVPAGWSLVSATCDDGSDPDSIDLQPGETVTCTFSNAIDRGTIIVEKIADPDDTDQMFDFTSNFAGDFSLGAGDNLATGNLLPSSEAGAYSVSENVPAGWSLVSATCDDGSDPDSIDLQPGETVTCTFSNAIDRGTIIVEKIADPDDTDQMFDFTSNFAGNFSLGAGDNLSTGNLLPSSEAGAYSVSENVPAGWSLVSATCDDGSDPDSIDLQPGETVTCTFSNAIDRGTIIVEKIADPDDTDQMFDFTSNFAGNFSLGAGDNLSTGNLLPSSEAGAYSVSENVPEGWDLVSATCDGGHSPDAIELGAGETVTCTFTNVQRASLTVRKVAIGGDDVFEFSSDALGDGTDPLVFTIDTAVDDPPEVMFGNLDAGTYDVTEHLGDSDWILLDSFCNVGPEQIVENADGTIIVDILPGQHVVCTFENALPGTVSLTKSTIGGDGEFEFTFEDETNVLEVFTLITDGGSAATEFVGLEPGEYTFTETDLPEHWELTDVYCTQIDSEGNETTITGDLDLRTVTFDLAFGDTVGCLFENTRDGQIIIQKVTVPSGSNQMFEFVGPDGSALNTTLGDGGEASDHFQPGSYTVGEVVPEGWADPIINCEGGVASSSEWAGGSLQGESLPIVGETVHLSAGETVTCIFTNTQLSSIAVAKQTIPAGSSQQFEFTGDLAGTIGDGGTIVQIDVPAGTYTSTEVVPAGWDLESIECEGTDPANVIVIDDGNGVSVELGEGENVLCTFTNRALDPGIEIVKTDGGIIIGQDMPLVYTLNYGNTGDLDLSDVVITETVPENTTFDAAGSSPGWSCADGSEAGTVCELSIGDLAIGESGSVAFGLMVGVLWEPDPQTGLCGPPPPSPLIDNTASIVGTSSNGDVGDEDSDTTPVSVDCDDLTGLLTVEKVVSSGDPDQVFEFAGSDSTGGFDSFSLGHGDSISFGLPVGTYSVTEIVPAGWELQTAECTGDNTIDDIEIGAAGNVTCTFTNRQLEPGISIVKTYTAATISQGGAMAFLLTYQNTGEVDLTDVTILETIPENTSFNPHGANGGDWDCSGNDCLYEVGDLAAGESGEVRFPLMVDVLWAPDPNTGLCGPQPQDPRVDNTADIIGTSPWGDVHDNDDISIIISMLCQDQEDEHFEPIPVPVTTPTGLAALALLMMALAQLALRRRKQVRRN